MRNIPIALLLIGAFLTTDVFAKEITLINSKGESFAYTDTDEDLTIYLWDGKPVAYIADGSVWGFNGKLLDRTAPLLRTKRLRSTQVCCRRINRNTNNTGCAIGLTFSK